MNFKTIVATLLLSIIVSAHASASSTMAPPPVAKGKVYEDPDIPPLFTGGTAAMHNFISSSLKYPAEAAENNIQGLVVYTFTVETDGTLTDFDIIHRADPQLDQEALRILKSMPPWRPGKYKNQVVRSKTYVPMYFKLNKNAARGTRRAIDPSQTYGKVNEEIKNSEVYSIVDKMPSYPHGERELGGFIAHNMRYPKEARQQGIEGRVLCSFIVAADGTITNIEIVQGLHDELDKEAVRVLSLMSKWNPGIKNGEKVNVKCLLPIDFSIDEEPIPAG